VYSLFKLENLFFTWVICGSNDWGSLYAVVGTSVDCTVFRWSSFSIRSFDSFVYWKKEFVLGSQKYLEICSTLLIQMPTRIRPHYFHQFFINKRPKGLALSWHSIELKLRDYWQLDPDELWPMWPWKVGQIKNPGNILSCILLSRSSRFPNSLQVGQQVIKVGHLKPTIHKLRFYTKPDYLSFNGL
jgi:hypothetical protein